MRAIPSPTDRTWPTSATSASVPKSAICCFRMAEISAARISMSSNPLHRKLQTRELALERCVHHARADLDHEAADQARIDTEIDRNLAADGLAQLLVDRLGLSRRQRPRRRHLSAPGRELLEIARDHARQDQEPTIARDDAEKIPGQGGKPRPLRERRHGLALLDAAHHRTPDQAAEIRALVDQDAERAQVVGDLVQRLAVVGELEQRLGVALGETGYACRFGCHVERTLERLLTRAGRRRLKFPETRASQWVSAKAIPLPESGRVLTRALLPAQPGRTLAED